MMFKKMDKRLKYGLVLGVILALILATVALADNVVNDVTVDGTDTFTAGGSTTVNYWIVATGGDEQAGCNASDGSAATVTINAPSGVTATPGSRTFTACGTGAAQSVIFTSTTPGDYEITVSVSDSGPGEYHTTPGGFTLHVLAPSTPTDTTAPVITYVLDPPAPDGLNDWYISNVSIVWTVTDPESAYTIDEGCVDETIDFDTAGVTLTCEATSAGGTSSESVMIKRDAMAPTVTVTPDRGPDHNGWYNAPVTFDTEGTDATSGVSDANCTADQIFTAPDGSPLSVNGSCTDNAGNIGYGTSAAFNFDDTDPTLNPSVSPDPVVLNGLATASANAVDNLSGVASSSCDAVDTSSVGTHSVTCYAEDNAGNTNTASANYSVTFAFAGFFAPIDMDKVNSAKAGQAIPVKWRLTDANGQPISDPASFVSITSSPSGTCGSGDSDVIEIYAGSSGLQYLGDGYWQYNWKTPKSYAGQCRTMSLNLSDGTSHTADFLFK